MNLLELYDNFSLWHNSNAQPFLLFDIVNATENDHTRLLQRLLAWTDRNGKRIFLESFLADALGLNANGITDVIITDQQSALGIKDGGKGMINLFISYKDSKGTKKSIIIENKINDACDTDNQLNRYVYTLIKPQQSFDEWIGNPVYLCAGYDIDENVYENIRVVYLTKDGQKEPSTKSLNEVLKNNLGKSYVPMNYVEDILPWLKENVLPQCPYDDKGILIAGMQQYIAYLEYLLKPTEGLWMPYEEIRKEFPSLTDIELYECLGEIQLDDAVDKDSATYKAFLKQINIFREYMFDDSAFLADDWTVHVTPSFICLYKKAWQTNEERKYNAPSLIYTCSMSQYKQGKGANIEWKLILTHLPVGSARRNHPEQYTSRLYRALRSLNMYDGKVRTSNHDRDRIFGDARRIDVNFDVNDKTQRVCYLNEFIDSITAETLVIDAALKNI